MFTMFRVVALIIFLTSISMHPANAGWVDDWLSQSTYSGMDSFEGQKRGYMSGGNLSARFPTSSDYLFTLSTPRFKRGCGGIDIFLGGFSYLDMDKLGEKLQRIMTAAPVFAFDIALKTLCEQCSETMKALENIANRLNSLQLDDCKAAKTLVTMSADLIKGDNDALKSEFNQLKMDMGIDDLFQDTDEATRTDPQGTASTVRTELTGGDPDIDELLYGEGSLLKKAGDKYGMGQDWVNLARGYIGDIVWIGASPLDIQELTPCEDNKKDEDYSDFVEGKAKARVDDGNGNYVCQDIPDTNRSIFDYVRNMVTSIVEKTKNKQTLTLEEEEFIRKSPVPAFLHIKIAIAQKNDNYISELLTDKLSYIYAVKQLKDLYEITYKALERYHAKVSNKETDSHLVKNVLGKIDDYEMRIINEVTRLNRTMHNKTREYLDVAEMYIKKQEVFVEVMDKVFHGVY